MTAVAVVPVRTGRVFQPYTPYFIAPDTLFGQAVPGGVTGGAQSPYTLGTQFAVSRESVLDGIWWYSYPSATVLPSACGIWNTSSAGAVAQDSSPAWRTGPGGSAAAAGSGWVYCDFTGSGVLLETGISYVTAVFQPASGVAWWCTVTGYWSTGPGRSGLVSGVLSAPSRAASVNGQGCYDTTGAWTFPGTDPGNGEIFYVDVQVTG